MPLSTFKPDLKVAQRCSLKVALRCLKGGLKLLRGDLKEDLSHL